MARRAGSYLPPAEGTHADGCMCGSPDGCGLRQGLAGAAQRVLQGLVALQRAEDQQLRLVGQLPVTHRQLEDRRDQVALRHRMSFPPCHPR